MRRRSRTSSSLAKTRSVRRGLGRGIFFDLCFLLGLMLISTRILCHWRVRTELKNSKQRRQRDDENVFVLDCGLEANSELQEAAEEDAKSTASGAVPVVDSDTKGTTLPHEDESTDDIFIDMISVSSHSRPHYPVVQQASFGSHHSVRKFWVVTEDDDDDPACHDLTLELVQQISKQCRSPSTYSKIPLMKRHFAPAKWLLEKTKNPTGWLCAQKRPLTALHRVLQSYGIGDQDPAALPDYLFVMDDDSWFHLEHIIPVLRQRYPSHQAHLVAGCLIRSPHDDRFAFYWGGFGVILTKRVIERMLMPLTCRPDWTLHEAEPVLPWHDTSDFLTDHDFVQYACHKIALNLIGEQHFYRTNMTLVDLIHEYALQQPYSSANEWHADATYCMHSDTTLAYFWQYYHVARHARDDVYATVDYDRMEGYQDSIKIKVSDENVKPSIYESRGECAHVSNDDCTVDDHLCHYVTATHMQQLFETIQDQAPPGLYHSIVDMPVIEYEEPIAKHPDALRNRMKRQTEAAEELRTPH